MKTRSSASKHSPQPRKTYCSRHFLEAASAWYWRSIERSVDILGNFERAIETQYLDETSPARKSKVEASARRDSATTPEKGILKTVKKGRVQKRPVVEPRRVQPRRAAKDKNLFYTTGSRLIVKPDPDGPITSAQAAEVESPSKHVHFANQETRPSGPTTTPLTAARSPQAPKPDALPPLPLPCDESQQIIEPHTWYWKLIHTVQRETMRLMLEVVEGNEECPIKAKVPLACEVCISESATKTAEKPSTRKQKGERTAPVAAMEADERTGRHISTIDEAIPEEYIIKYGAFRFFVDICDGEDKYMVFE